jgi:hypothetical protein
VPQNYHDSKSPRLETFDAICRGSRVALQHDKASPGLCNRQLAHPENAIGLFKGFCVVKHPFPSGSFSVPIYRRRKLRHNVFVDMI